ncbi:peptidoglycan-binding protein [Ancylobacter sp. 6x-1]|uniref:Peptidoglycan-binding protein n=1 Tax=Ancylobacter crimeensis TaxID=2579147 RepID=A0ABT0D8U1_9HYPH|nr:peptidoglycan-binding protein [Ancylobacter crimeensis]MCK0196373.1 peptidoglycan-binding protein [Ancylobacter crimeensis]
MARSLFAELTEDDIAFQRGRSSALGGLLPTRRSDVLITLLCLAGACAVVVNALSFQTATRGPASSRGAAPATSVPLPVAAPSPTERTALPQADDGDDDAPLPPSKPAANMPAPAPAVPTPAAKPRPAAQAIGAPVQLGAASPAPVAAKPSGIASLLGGDAAVARPPADVAVSPRVMEVQKALAKLGYGPLKIDGRTGGMTEEAIKRFERDRRLPITGQVNDPLVRELNAVSGMAIR